MGQLQSTVIDGDRTVCPLELEELVAERARAVGSGALVLLSAGRELDAVVTYLACLRSRSPMIVTGPDASAVDRLVDVYDPDVIVRSATDSLERRHDRPRHDPHPELALLLSTSGSTGTPKLVRLSRTNVAANAAAIAEYMGLGADDRAVTSLPLHYCYGLSVVGSHLHAGGDVVLTDRSVVDPCFWDLVRSTGVTTLAGVPHTFDLLDRTGFSGAEAPALRRLTQAGGRLAPERVRQYAELGKAAGFELYVMYGQTEATARMAFLPPLVADSRPTAVGIPVPGGELDIRPLPPAEAARWPDDVGEVVYRGPNVMMGYATGPADLALGPGGDELRTGDIGRIADDGLLELVGRRGRFTKIFGCRLDLDDLERRLAEAGTPAWCGGDDHRLVLATVDGSVGDVTASALAVTGLPASRVSVVEVGPELPRTTAGKPDRSVLGAAVSAVPAVPVVSEPNPWPAGGRDTVREVFAAVLSIDEVEDDDTFVGLGGDSLCYVEASVVLDEMLGRLPRDWHLMTVAELESLGRASSARAERTARVEIGAVLRAVAIVLVVGNHMGVSGLPGGAHVLLAVAGYNLARFHIDPTGPGRFGRVVRSVATVAVPTVLWVAAWAAVTDRYGVPNLLLVSNWMTDPPADAAWRFWFVEVLVQCTLVVGGLFALAPVRTFERRRPFTVAAGALALALIGRFAPFEPDHFYLFRTGRVAWIVALGWAAQRARTVPQRLALTVVAAVATHGFSTIGHRNEVMLGGLLLLIWVRAVPVPAIGRRAVVHLAGASLGIYIVHSEIYPWVQRLLPPGPVTGPVALVSVLVASAAVGTALTSAGRALVARAAVAGRSAVARRPAVRGRR